MSDVHFGKATESFNPQICLERLDKVGERLAKMRELLSSYEFDELVVCMLGDMNDGSGIYPTQAFHQEITNVDEQAFTLAEYMGPWLREQRRVWGNVRVEGVPGNHGRNSKFAHEATNWDLVFYRYLSLVLKGDGIPVNFGDEIRKVNLRSHPWLLYHGHGIKSYSGIPLYGLQNRLKSWGTTHLAPFTGMMCGHFHVTSKMMVNNAHLLLSGTAVTGDEFALSLGYESNNIWWLFGVSDERPRTWQFEVDVV